MRAFYLAYAAPSKNLAPPGQEIPSEKLAPSVQDFPPEAIQNLPWSHNIILVQKLKDNPTRLWHAAKAAEHGWRRNILSLQIDNQAHKRHGKAITNFRRTLPSPQSDVAQQIVKDPYPSIHGALDKRHPAVSPEHGDLLLVDLSEDQPEHIRKLNRVEW